MSDQEHIELSAKQTPLPDLLDRVPEDIVLCIPGDEPVFPSYTNIPIGRLARDAAAELRRLHEAHDWQYRMAGERLRRIEKLEAQRDALLAALKDIAGTDPVDAALDPQRAVRIARAAIKATVEEGK